MLLCDVLGESVNHCAKVRTWFSATTSMAYIFQHPLGLTDDPFKMFFIKPKTDNKLSHTQVI